ncbi:hypothetical protein OSH11_19530 [Kaistia dalseonensis]|uniref:Transmembrane protein n=1 Tax=Kaistia dalseonensis TaxID=410840 RepID=A0ABU0HB80_9HYPH|nr:hypothetical protein [Kaistia dalseonensis]MCX5496905.1 hypothetical protein [Kaistia dalseonensis]MDQ0439530.1 hypothetical protein [Kaistia dalseonensis]
MSTPSQPEGPKWRSGPFVYGAVLVSLPLIAVAIWALPIVAPLALKGNLAAPKALGGLVWFAIVLLAPVGALYFRRLYHRRAEWRRPRSLSIVFAGLAYVVSILSYVAIALLMTKFNL